MKTVLGLFALAVISVMACPPAVPTCPTSSCVYLWLGNFVPSLTAQSFDYYVDGVKLVIPGFSNGLPYEGKYVYPLACSNTTTVHEFGVGDPLQGGELGNTQVQVSGMQCGFVYSVFAWRRPNTQTGTEQYAVNVRIITGDASFGFFSGLYFNGIYRGNTVNGKYCRYDQNTGPGQCTRDPDQGRNNNGNAQIGLWQQMDMRMETGYANPVTLTTGGNTLYDAAVSGSVGGCETWIFYGDNQNQNAFPLMGGVSSAHSLIASSMTLMLLGVLIMLF